MTYVEVGVYRLETFLEVMKVTPPDCIHYGLDLFEEAPEAEIAPTEGPPFTYAVAEAMVGDSGILLKGPSSETMGEIGWDQTCGPFFVFIDGGHSEETVVTDFDNVLAACMYRKTDVLFDDTNFPGVVDGLNKIVGRLRENNFPFNLHKFNHPFFMAMISWG